MTTDFIKPQDTYVLGEYAHYIGDGLYSYGAYVWDEQTNSVKSVSTDGGYEASQVRVVADAPEDVVHKANLLARHMEFDRLTEQYERRSAEVRKGRRVEVTRGRKIPLGTEGIVVWEGEANYGYRPTKRVGIKLDDGSVVYTALSNVEVLRPSKYMMDVDTIAELTHNVTWRTVWAGSGGR